MNYTFGFPHSTKYGKKDFERYVVSRGGFLSADNLSFDDWADYYAYFDFYAEDDNKAREIGLKLFNDLNALFGVDIFTLSSDYGCYFTEEQL